METELYYGVKVDPTWEALVDVGMEWSEFRAIRYWCQSWATPEKAWVVVYPPSRNGKAFLMLMREVHLGISEQPDEFCPMPEWAKEWAVRPRPTRDVCPMCQQNLPARPSAVLRFMPRPANGRRQFPEPVKMPKMTGGLAVSLS